jgi:hypothetical protein
VFNRKWRLHLSTHNEVTPKKSAKKSTAKMAVLHKITMDRQGKCTGSEKKNSSLATMSGTPDHLQTQHHNHKAKSISVPGY